MYRGIVYLNFFYIFKIYDLLSEWIIFFLKIIEKWLNLNWWIYGKVSNFF